MLTFIQDLNPAHAARGIGIYGDSSLDQRSSSGIAHHISGPNTLRVTHALDTCDVWIIHCEYTSSAEVTEYGNGELNKDMKSMSFAAASISSECESEISLPTGSGSVKITPWLESEPVRRLTTGSTTWRGCKSTH